MTHPVALLRRILRDAERRLTPLRRRRHYRREIRRALARGREPVIVFTMSKTASTSIEVSLMQMPRFAVFKAHRLHPARIRAYYRERRRLGEQELHPYVDDMGIALYREIVRRRVPARIIVLVREPIGRNLSAYFHILNVLWKRSDAFTALSPQQVADGFIERGRHSEPLTWFDEEFRPVFDVDVFAKPFPHDVGIVQLRDGPFDIVVMRTDLPDDRKMRYLSDWLGCGPFEMVHMNDADQKHYADLYRAARGRLRLPGGYVDEMLESRYARHFFSAEERGRLREKWLSAPAPAAVEEAARGAAAPRVES
ncbi:MAG TPA: putative capsular polysaccharide synthesis family protein [Longimicrobiaceae bacterium]|nr:putative capsular polysaccharide synthesis family protein [Longimicrobiaceae bacterium]